MRARIPHCTAALVVLLLVPACAQDATIVEPATLRPDGASLAASPYSDWSPAVNFGAVVNSPVNDLSPAFSSDGRSLYFASVRPGGAGVADLWVSQRQPDGSWGAPVNLGAPLNTAAGEAAPSFSRDGHWMYFSSSRAGSAGQWDLWTSRRTDPHDDFAWQEPVNLAELNTQAFEGGATLHGTALFFSRGPTMPMPHDIWVTQLRGSTFTPPAIVEELSSEFDERRPSIRFDGREIFMNSDRPGGLGAGDIWFATRQGAGQPWTTPVNAGPAINSSADEAAPMLSPDGLTLLFTSTRPGGIGGSDLYYSTRTHASSVGTAAPALAELATAVAAPVESPFLIVFDDVNPCTGETATFRFEGTSRTQLVGEHRIVHIAGTVTTSDGWTGMFNRQLVFHGTDVSTRRFFDMEVGPDGQRQLFTSVLHITIVDGEIVTQVANPKLRCVGKPG
jgi:hypothetical protein